MLAFTIHSWQMLCDKGELASEWELANALVFKALEALVQTAQNKNEFYYIYCWWKCMNNLLFSWCLHINYMTLQYKCWYSNIWLGETVREDLFVLFR